LYSTILQVSGEDADKLNLNPFSPTYKVTRVDLQVTLRFDGPVESLAYDLYRHLALERELDSTAPLYRFISSETGDTVYIGRRDSPVFIRLYDKTSEYSYGDKGLYWRYEVEYKKSAAPRVVSRLWEEPNRTAYIASQVASELKKRGVTPQFSSTTTVTAIAVGASVSTNEGRLNWLARCVAPVVSQLIALGYGEAVFHALDLRSIAKYRGK
jgi:DNA relaxase NicK